MDMLSVISSLWPSEEDEAQPDPLDMPELPNPSDISDSRNKPIPLASSSIAKRQPTHTTGLSTSTHEFNWSFSPQPRNHNTTSLLSSNDAPDQETFTRYSQLLHDEHTRAEAWDSRITRLQEALSAALAGRDTYKRDLHDAKRILHPLRRIPTELLQEIFSYVAPLPTWDGLTGKETSAGKPIERRYPLYTLSRVCRRWRQGAEGMPEHWSFIQVSMSYQDAQHSTRIAEACRRHVVNSRGRPLSLVLRFRLEDDLFFEKAYPVLRALLPSSHRWLRLQLAISENCVEYLQALHGNLPMLSELQLSMKGRSAFSSFLAHDKYPYYNLFEHAPSLRKVQAVLSASRRLPSATQYLALPWGTITTWYHTGFNDSHLHSLSLLTHVQTCNLHCNIDMIYAWEGAVVELKHLRRLTISAASEDYHLILDNLSAPSLQSLDISADKVNGEVLSNFLKRSSSMVEMQLRKGFPDQLGTVLSAVPGLKTLALNVAVEEERLSGVVVNELLKQDHTGFSLVPALQSLVLSVEEDESAIDHSGLVQLNLARGSLNLAVEVRM